MPRSRERAKEISAVKSHVCLSSVQAHQARCFSCACCTRLFKARGSAECVRTWCAPFGTRFVLVTNRSRSSSTLEGLVPIPESHLQRRLSLSTVSHVHMLAVSIYSHLSGRPRTPRTPARSRRCRPIPGGLQLGEAPVSLLIVTPSVPVTNRSSSLSIGNDSGDRYPCLS